MIFNVKKKRNEAIQIIEPFYDLFRSAKRKADSSVWEKGFAVLHDDWKSYDNNPNPNDPMNPRNKAQTRDWLEKSMFADIPDIEVNVLEVFVDGDWIMARSELTGTFAKGTYLYGSVIGLGKNPFRIMALDYHRIGKNKKLVELYHNENWGLAFLQSGGMVTIKPPSR